MARTLTEEKVLKKLQINNFRELTKDKIITMASMLDKMDPEIAKKVIEQFPEFAKTTKEVLKDLNKILDKGIESNSESVKAYYSTCKTTIDALDKQLENDDLEFDEKKYIIEQMLEVSRMMGEKDSENKKFIATIGGIAAAAAVVGTMVLATVLGGDSKIGGSDS